MILRIADFTILSQMPRRQIPFATVNVDAVGRPFLIVYVATIMDPGKNPAAQVIDHGSIYFYANNLIIISIQQQILSVQN